MEKALKDIALMCEETIADDDKMIDEQEILIIANAALHTTDKELRFRAGLGEYLRSRGQRCPICNFDQLEGDSCEIDGDTMQQQVICSSCETTWYDIYRLEGTKLID